MKYAFFALLTFEIMLSAGPAYAQRVDHAAAGQRDFGAGRYRDALDHFTRAYEASGAPILLYNIGQSADRLRLDATTLRAFQLYLQRYPEAPNHEEVRHRIAVLTPLVATQNQALDAAKGDALIADQHKLHTRAQRTSVSVSETLLPSPYRAPATQPERGPDPDLMHNPWFWVAAGAVVVALVCTVVLVTTQAPSGAALGDTGGSTALLSQSF